MGALRRMIVKEFLQLRRDRKMIPVLIGAPLVQLIVLGFAANLDVSHVALLLVDSDRSAASRDLVERFVGSGYFDLVGSEESVSAVDPWLVDGRAQIVLVIGAGFGDDLAAGRPPRVQILADGSDANAGGIALGYASRIITGLGAESLESRHAPGALGSPGRIDLVPRIWYNPDLKSRWFYTPAILALVLMVTTIILPSMAVVREKEIGTLEQISVTPIRSWEFIVGKLVPFGIIGFLDLLLITGLVVMVLRVPLRGSVVTLAILTLPLLLTTLGLGLLVSTLVGNQQQAMMASVFFVMIPMIYLSGMIFPIENMPMPIQYVTRAIPLRYYSAVIRGVFSRGAGLAVLWPEGLTLLAYGSGVLLLATLRFRKSLE